MKLKCSNCKMTFTETEPKREGHTCPCCYLGMLEAPSEESMAADFFTAAARVVEDAVETATINAVVDSILDSPDPSPSFDSSSSSSSFDGFSGGDSGSSGGGGSGGEF